MGNPRTPSGDSPAPLECDGVKSSDDAGEVPESFPAFYRIEAERFRRFAYVLVANSSAADDLVQDAMARVEPRFASIQAPVAYTRAVLINLAKKHRARERSRAVAEQRVARPDRVSPEAAELLDVIDQLPFRQRAVIVLRYYEGLSESEIAVALGCRAGTVKSLASRALSRLRKELE